MAKTIKFNLILDNYPVRNIEGLQEHFSIEDMLKYFENGLLLRWLNVRGYEKQYAAVEAIDKSLNKKEIVMALVEIFEVVEMEAADIEKAIGILTYLDEEKELNAIYKENAFSKKQIIDDYHSGYSALVVHMEENKDNMAILKADAIQMEREYLGLFELNHDELYFRLLGIAPKAIFAILTRDAFRKFWIGAEASVSIYKNVITELLAADKAKEILGDDLKIVKRNTQAMWDPIERPEVKLMVISIESGTFIKNAGEFSEKLASTDVNDKLMKFNGLEYQCNNEYYELLYMEV
ncbi:MAG: hypothetical protein K2P64_05465 [Lachnospiraceae bacterium]|mgnify:CR=1 FL=1|nr:hypothetical protein [Lachnospiraceae bacterium]